LVPLAFAFSTLCGAYAHAQPAAPAPAPAAPAPAPAAPAPAPAAPTPAPAASVPAPAAPPPAASVPAPAASATARAASAPTPAGDLQSPAQANTRNSAYTLPRGMWAFSVGGLGIGSGDAVATLGATYGIGAGLQAE